MSFRPAGCFVSCRPAALATAVLMAASACAGTPPAPMPAAFTAWDVVGDGRFTSGIEGPAVGPDGALYAVNFEREGTIGRVEIGPDGRGTPALFVELPAGSTGNGIRFDDHGFMFVADYAGHHLLRVDPATRDVIPFAAMPGAHQPNDLARAPNGIFYASDPDWSTDSGQLWRVMPDGSEQLLESGMGTTNGIEVSPDGRRLYVNESVQRRVWVYDIDTNGDVGNKRELVRFDDHGLDGMRCDVDGNLYIARYGAGVVAIVSPSGEVLREVALKGEKPTNVAFGGEDGRTVFVTLQDRGAIEAFRAEIPGREAGG